VADQFGAENVIVVFGLNEPDNLRIMATTFKDGDPSFAGALAGVALGLKSYHVLELKDEIPEEVWNAEMAMEELELEESVSQEIRRTMREIRGG
jgi:hypothetical protein